MCEPVASVPHAAQELHDSSIRNSLLSFNPILKKTAIPGSSLATNSEARNVSLPQDASAQQRIQRNQQVARRRELYRWTYSAISDAALIETLPASEFPNRRWVVQMKRVENRCKENKEAISSSSSTQISHPTNEKPDPLQQFKSQFATIDLPKLAFKNDFLRDEMFGWYRIAGPNPMVLKQLKVPLSESFPSLNDEVFKNIPHFETDSLKQAHEEKRLFEVDYSHLQHIHSCAGNGKDGMHLYSPRVLLAVPKSINETAKILPIAIQCNPSVETIHTASRKHTSQTAWQAAKLTVQVADAFVHETVFHFARTHLLLEAILCASYRTLPDSHPVLRLLSSHFEGTAFINDTSLRALICPGGPIDQITAPAIEDTREFAAKSLVQDFDFTKSMPDTDFVNRGVDKRSAPSLQYPYRDDALNLWDAILTWSKEYIDVFYIDDCDVKADYEIQLWGREVRNMGRIRGFGSGQNGTFSNKEDLSRTVSMIIFTASVQHAAVNFPQKEMMQFAPAMPLAGYDTVPDPQEYWNTNDKLCGLENIAQMLPGMSQAEQQLSAAELLGVVRYTRLGQYGKRLELTEEKIVRALQRFQLRLEELEQNIVIRNYDEDRSNLIPYSFLKPSLIPQSTNV